METREEFYEWKEQIDEGLDYVMAKLDEIELKLLEVLAIEQEIGKLLNEMKQKMMANRALIAKAEKEQDQEFTVDILSHFKYN